MATKVLSDFINLNELPLEDTSISKIEFYETKISNPDTETNPRFNIDFTDQWVLPCEAYIQLTGKVVKSANGANYNAGTNIALVNNGLMHLFSQATYKIDNQSVEMINNPGDATLVTSLVDYSNDYVDMMGEQLMIVKDVGANNTAAGNTGHAKRKEHQQFDVSIPLSHIFRFCKDIKKVFYGMPHSIEFVKQNRSSNALLKANGVDDGKVQLSNMSLWMPRVIPSPETMARLTKFISGKKTMMLPFRQLKFYSDVREQAMTDITWNISSFNPTDRPRHVFVAFQLTEKLNDQEQNNSVFDACQVTDIHLTVNGEQYPRVPYNINFAEKRIGRPFRDLMNYRGIDNNYDSGMLITKSDFLTRYPLYHFDLEHMPESINNTVSSMQLKATLDAGGQYRVMATVLADRDLRFTADGQKMNVHLR